MQRAPAGVPLGRDVEAVFVRAEDERRNVAVIRGVSDRRRAESSLAELNARLQDSDRRKDIFLAMLSHEPQPARRHRQREPGAAHDAGFDRHITKSAHLNRRTGTSPPSVGAGCGLS